MRDDYLWNAAKTMPDNVMLVRRTAYDNTGLIETTHVLMTRASSKPQHRVGIVTDEVGLFFKPFGGAPYWAVAGLIERGWTVEAVVPRDEE